MKLLKIFTKDDKCDNIIKIIEENNANLDKVKVDKKVLRKIKAMTTEELDAILFG